MEGSEGACRRQAENPVSDEEVQEVKRKGDEEGKREGGPGGQYKRQSKQSTA